MLKRKKTEDRAYMPHCDSSVLHAPGECEFCDEYPDFQHYRVVARINFSGHYDRNKAPCPSTFFRPEATIDKWGGNVATNPDDTELWEKFREAKNTPLI